jgi:pilus assembly protein Flp/PilA
MPTPEVKLHMINRFFQEEEGQTLVEYGLLISLVALVVIAVLTLLGRRISNTFNAASNTLSTSTS